MLLSKRKKVATTLKPNALYGTKVGLRIGTGGSGQSGFLQVLAEAFIEYHCKKTGDSHFQIEWYTSDTSFSIQYLQQDIVDVGITYHAIAEQTALDQGTCDRVEYAWRDHWMLVGPKSNPAQLPKDGKGNVYVLFTKLFSALEAAAQTDKAFSFLSRYDKSACNITESTIWATIGQTPWVDHDSEWYNRAEAFPFEALEEAAHHGQYTLTDYGTWCAVDPEVRDKLEIYKKGSDEESDPLLNPAHVLVGTHAKNKKMANAFADWMVLRDGGQKIVKEFERFGARLYEPAPEPARVDPLGKSKALLANAEDI